jgi:hypothetical protein
MGSTRCGASTPQWAMTKDSTEVFLVASSGNEGFCLPSHRRNSTSASLAPTTITPRIENALAVQAATTVPPRAVVPQAEADQLSSWGEGGGGRQQAQAHPQHPTNEEEVVLR